MGREVSARVAGIKPFIVMTLLEKAKELERQGHAVVHLEIGEPDFDTPGAILDAAMRGCRAGATHYTHSLGTLALRESIAGYKKQSRNLSVDPGREIMVTAGSSPGFLMIMGSLLNPGDEVVITDPGYPCYQNFVRFFGGKPVPLPIHEEDNFNFNVDKFKELITDRTKIVMLNSPSNPTGQIIPRATLEEIATLAVEHDLWVVSDEIYAELTYTGRIAPSMSVLNGMLDRVIVLDGFSKFWAMTGWRLGYIIAPPALLSEMNKVNQNFLICAPSMSQEAAIAALACKDETKNMLAKYRKRRDYIVKRISEMDGLSIVAPSGAFYAFSNIKELTHNSLEFSLNLLENVHVAATPGIGFGENGEGYMRFTYTKEIPELEEGMNRLEQFIKTL
ncbi:MAG: pyridoxal phosphate-dependent aminotransferase [Promethearchaeota archaeon]